MKKICVVCNDEFVGHHNSKYCSSQCQKEAYKGVLLPDPKKKYRHALPYKASQSWKF